MQSQHVDTRGTNKYVRKRAFTASIRLTVRGLFVTNEGARVASLGALRRRKSPSAEFFTKPLHDAGVRSGVPLIEAGDMTKRQGRTIRWSGRSCASS